MKNTNRRLKVNWEDVLEKMAHKATFVFPLKQENPLPLWARWKYRTRIAEIAQIRKATLEKEFDVKPCHHISIDNNQQIIRFTHLAK